MELKMLRKLDLTLLFAVALAVTPLPALAEDAGHEHHHDHAAADGDDPHAHHRAMMEKPTEAAKTDAEVILFCGVDFMAETAAILCPEKTVLLPDKHAGCPMANMVNDRELRREKEKHPNATVICYVNSSAEVKAESDICCTSSNAVKIVESVPADQEIIFVPDQSLGGWAAKIVRKSRVNGLLNHQIIGLGICRQGGSKCAPIRCFLIGRIEVVIGKRPAVYKYDP